jgi:peptide/histidine transporter 3/4
MRQLYKTYKNGLKERSLNLPGYVLIFYSISIGMSTTLGFNITLSLVSDPEPISCWFPAPSIKEANSVLISIVQGSLYFILYPVVGWLSDTIIGRSKTIQFSVWFCWFGTLLQVISYCIQYGTCGAAVSVAKYGISFIALVCIMIGTASYQTNILAYGLDQLHEYSNTHVRAFIHWIVWAQFFGFLLSYIAYSRQIIYDSKLTLITSIIVFATTSIAVLLSIFCDNVFKSIGILKNNPYSLVYKVLKYAKDNNVPANRSSLTYWDDKIPSRLDFGKICYGGPFSEDEVEAVKTVIRIVIVFILTFGFYIPLYLMIDGALPFIESFDGAKTDIHHYGSVFLWIIFNKLTLLVIPVLEIIILPLYPKFEFFILNPLKSLFIAYIFELITLILMSILDIIGHSNAHGNSASMCYLSTDTEQPSLPISYYIYSIPLFFSGIAVVISHISILEFICSQAPVNMSGMLTGIFYFIRGFYASLGPCLQLALKRVKSNNWFTCTFWAILIQIIICLIGIFLFYFTVKWYKGRRRGEEYYINDAIERKYEQLLRTGYGATGPNQAHCTTTSN